MAEEYDDSMLIVGSGATVTEEAAANQYVANRYDGLFVGPELTYTFENQDTVPYDGSNKQARNLSPFTMRLVVPEALLHDETDIDVNLMGRGSMLSTDLTNQANEFRSILGMDMVSPGNATGALTGALSTLSAGLVLQTMLGTEERSVLADNVTVADIKYQVEKMLQTPPLTLFINPQELSISYTAVQQFSQRTRYGFVFERWGEGQPVLSISGSTGAFCAGMDPTATFGLTPVGGQNSNATGVQFATKRDSAAFQQFVSLYHIYRNNGYIYDSVEKSQAMLFVGAVAIDYDQMTYVGNINSFEYSYDESEPNRILWSMEFTVGRMYDHAESPIVVLPESSPTPSKGSLSVTELAAMMASTPRSTDIENATVGQQILGLSGTQQFVGDGKDAEKGDPNSTTPLEALGAFFTPSGTFEPGFTD